MAQLTSLFEHAIDLIWPRLTGQPDKQPELGDADCEMGRELAEEVHRMLIIRMAQVEARNETVDRKLLSLFRTTSILATVAIAIFVGAANLTPISNEIPKPIVWICILVILYAFAQLLRATMATLKGLNASGYARHSKCDLMPTDSDSVNTYITRQLQIMMYVVEQNGFVTNEKISQMNIAHTALRNALCSLPLLITMALLLAFFALE